MESLSEESLEPNWLSYFGPEHRCIACLSENRKGAVIRPKVNEQAKLDHLRNHHAQAFGLLNKKARNSSPAGESDDASFSFDGESESTDSQEPMREQFRAVNAPVIIGQGQTRLAGWLTYNGISWKEDVHPTYNKHIFAAACRYAIGTMTSRCLAGKLTGTHDYEYDYIILWPRRAELLFYPTSVVFGTKKTPTPSRAAGYRLVLDGIDWAREGRIVYDTQLNWAKFFVSHDGLLYYRSPEQVITMFADHPEIDKGISILASGRPLLSGNDKVWLEHFTHPEFTTHEKDVEVRLPRALHTVAKSPDGTPLMNIDGKPIEVRTRTVTIEPVTYERLDVYEGVGWTVSENDIEFHASCGKTGDSVYPHRLDGDLWFTSLKLVYGRGGDVYTYTIHQEGSVGPYVLLNIHLMRTKIGDDCADGLLERVQRDRPETAYVVGGVIPSLLDPFRVMAGRHDLENAEALRKLNARALETLLEKFGKANWENLDLVADRLKRAADRTMTLAIDALQREHKPITHGGQDREAAKANVQARVEESGLGKLIGGVVAELSVKQTRLQLIVSLLARIKQWIVDAWHAIWGEAAPANVLVALAKLSVRFMGKFENKLSMVTRLQKWFSKSEEANDWAETVLLVVGDVIVPVVEEVLKRFAPWYMSFIFGAIEGLLVGLDENWDADTGLEKARAVLQTALTRSVAHGILRLIPLWMSVPGHVSFNVLTHLRRWTARFGWAGQWLEVAIDEIEMVRVGKNKLFESDSIYHLDVDGSHRKVVAPLDLPMISKKRIVLQTPASDLLVETSGNLNGFLTIITQRLDEPLNTNIEEDEWMLAAKNAATAVYDLDMRTRLMTYEECHEYVDDRPWPKSLKEYNHDVLTRTEASAHLKKTKVIFSKKEILVGKETLADEWHEVEQMVPGNESDLAPKNRPIIPASETDVQLMRLAVPLKKVLSRAIYASIVKGQMRFFTNYAQAFAASDNRRVASFNYAPAATAADRTKWLNDALFEEFCWHVNQYGDDHVSVLAWLRKAFAVDFSRCDRTCGTEFHEWFAYFVGLIFMDQEADELLKLMRSRLTGEFKLESAELAFLEAIYYLKKEEYTNTGEYLTAIKALCAGFSSWLCGVEPWLRAGGEPNVHLERAMKALGYIPEFETDFLGLPMQTIDQVTFLGGRWCDVGHSYVFYNAKFLKAYTIFPDTERIYGPFHHEAAHMKVLLSDPDLYVTPDGRALARWFTRCLEDEPATMSENRAIERWKQHLSRNGAGRFELERWEQNANDAATKGLRIDMASWTRHVQNVMDGCYGPYVVPHTPAEVVGELDTLTGFPSSVHTADYWYVLRYGKCKMQNYVPLAPLNIVKAIFDLGTKIFHVFNTMSEKKKTKQRPKKGEQQTTKGTAITKELAALRKEVADMKRVEMTPIGAAANYAGKAQNHKPKISMESGATVVRHRELIGTISGSTLWSVQPFILQPGLAGTFPWLAQIAASYEQYRFRKLTFRLMTSVGTGTDGNVYMIPDYDAGDAQPPSEALGMVNDKAKGGAPWSNWSLVLKSSDMHPKGQRNFTRHAGLASFSDIRTFDVGVLFVCTIGTPSTAMCRLFVDYEVELHVPQYDTTTTSLAMAGGVSRVFQANFNNGTNLFDWVNASRAGTTLEYLGGRLSNYSSSAESIGGFGHYLFAHALTIGRAYKVLVRMYAATGSVGFTGPGGFVMDYYDGIASLWNAFAIGTNLSGGGFPYMIFEAVFVAAAGEALFHLSLVGTFTTLVEWAADVSLLQIPAALAGVSLLPGGLAAPLLESPMTSNGNKCVARQCTAEERFKALDYVNGGLPQRKTTMR